MDRGHESEEEEEEADEEEEEKEEEEEMLRFKDRLVPSITETGCHPLLPLENSVRTDGEEDGGDEELHVGNQTPDLALSYHCGHSLTPPVEQKLKWRDKKKQVHFAHCN